MTVQKLRSAAPTRRRSAASSRRQRTRDAIVDAAAEVLADRGPASITVEAILDASGVARATFYAHFNDRNEVIREVIARVWRRASTRYANFAAALLHDEMSVRSWLAAFLQAGRAHHREVVALLRDMPVEIVQASDGYVDEFAAVLVGDERHWRCTRPEALVRASLLIVQLERAMMDLCRSAWRVSEEALLDSLTKLWLQALTTP